MTRFIVPAVSPGVPAGASASGATVFVGLIFWRDGPTAVSVVAVDCVNCWQPGFVGESRSVS